VTDALFAAAFFMMTATLALSGTRRRGTPVSVFA
jgi:hypothetical protein